MIGAGEFCALLRSHSITVVAGVPCSGLAGPIAQLSRQGEYLPAANEGAALAIAAGAAAAGRRAGVIAQNSGLGNLINPLTSLVMPYGIGVVVFVSMRGWPDPAADEPQHAVMGQCSSAMLRMLGVAIWELRAESTAGQLEAALAGAAGELSSGRPAFILIARGAVAADGAEPQQPVQPRSGARERLGVIRSIRPLLRGIPVVATTGYTARDLFASGDADHHFYMQGSMGHAAAVALGLACRRQAAGSGPVVILDGDGALLMHLGTLSTIGAARPVPLVHLVFDNRCYESTGGQPTTSGTADFAAIALACGYQTACEVTGDAELTTLLSARLGDGGPHLIVVPTRPAAGPAPPRATSALPLPAIFRRFAAVASAGSSPAEGHPDDS